MISCPSCGGNLKVESSAVKMAVCEHCGASSIVTGNRTTLFEEQQVPLVDYPTRFEIGQQITIQKKKWIVQGYLDYRYEGGFWEEWWLIDEAGNEAWLQVDEGGISLLHETNNPLDDQTKNYLKSEAQIGRFYPLGKINCLITHIVKQEGKIAYAKGNFPYLIKPNQPISYIEGVLWKDSNKPVLFCWEWDESSESFTKGNYLFFREITLEAKDSHAFEQPERFQKWALRCPNCGGSLEIANPHSQFCVCQYCGSTLKDPTGKLELFQASHGDKEKSKHFEFKLGETLHIGPQVFQVVGRNLWKIKGEEFWIESDEDGTERGIDRYTILYPEYNLYNPLIGLIRMYKDEGKYYLYQKTLPIRQFYKLFRKSKTWPEARRRLFSYFDKNGLERGKGSLIYFDGESTYWKHIGQTYFFMDYLNEQTSEALLNNKGQIVEVEFYNSHRCFPLRKEEYEAKKAKLPRFQPSFQKEWPIFLGLLIGLWLLFKGCSTTVKVTETVTLFEDKIDLSQNSLKKSYPPILFTNRDSLFYEVQISFTPSTNSIKNVESMEAIFSLHNPESNEIVYAVRFFYNPYANTFVPIQWIENDSITSLNYQSPKWIHLPDLEQKFNAPFALESTLQLQPTIQIYTTRNSSNQGIVEWKILQHQISNSIRTTEHFSPLPSTYLMLGTIWSVIFLIFFIYRRSVYKKLKKQVMFDI